MRHQYLCNNKYQIANKSSELSWVLKCFKSFFCLTSRLYVLWCWWTGFFAHCTSLCSHIMAQLVDSKSSYCVCKVPCDRFLKDYFPKVCLGTFVHTTLWQYLKVRKILGKITYLRSHRFNIHTDMYCEMINFVIFKKKKKLF